MNTKMPTIDPAFASELRSSGVSLSAMYLGSVPVMESMSVMVGEMRTQVVSECIQLVASKIGLCEDREINPIVSRIIGEVKTENYLVDLNISAKMVKVIKNNRLIQRHPVTYFSFGSQGQKDTPTEKMFGYIAKNKDGNDRRCHIVSSKDVQKLIDVLVGAINVSTIDARAKLNPPSTPDASVSSSGSEGTSDGSGARRSNLSRQSFVTNCRPSVHEDVKDKIWYHGNLSRDDAQALLITPGDYLVRQSDNTPGKFVLSGLTDEGEHKHLILLDHLNRVRTRDRQFNNISELIDYHVQNKMQVRSESGAVGIDLIRPVPSAQTPTPSSAPSPTLS
uniref:SH2 domain-containing protein n=1 Tax=Caenorhabditis tropicalis TaxID=1561998 RepID=A0A1I7UEM2_9PELO